MTEPGPEQACSDDHGGVLAQELRALALVALDRLEPLLARLRDVVVDPPAAACPVCAALAAVRAERPASAGRVAEHAAGLAAALREALADRGPDPHPEPPPARPVQRIPVERIPVQRIPVERAPVERLGGTPC